MNIDPLKHGDSGFVDPDAAYLAMLDAAKDMGPGHGDSGMRRFPEGESEYWVVGGPEVYAGDSGAEWGPIMEARMAGNYTPYWNEPNASYPDGPEQSEDDKLRAEAVRRYRTREVDAIDRARDFSARIGAEQVEDDQRSSEWDEYEQGRRAGSPLKGFAKGAEMAPGRDRIPFVPEAPEAAPAPSRGGSDLRATQAELARLGAQHDRAMQRPKQDLSAEMAALNQAEAGYERSMAGGAEMPESQPGSLSPAELAMLQDWARRGDTRDMGRPQAERGSMSAYQRKLAEMERRLEQQYPDLGRE